MCTGFHLPEVQQPGRKDSSPFNLVPRLRMHGVIPALYHTLSSGGWCRIKYRDNFTGTVSTYRSIHPSKYRRHLSQLNCILKQFASTIRSLRTRLCENLSGLPAVAWRRTQKNQYRIPMPIFRQSAIKCRSKAKPDGVAGNWFSRN
jgi:hypothetical protein